MGSDFKNFYNICFNCWFCHFLKCCWKFKYEIGPVSVTINIFRDVHENGLPAIHSLLYGLNNFYNRVSVSKNSSPINTSINHFFFPPKLIVNPKLIGYFRFSPKKASSLFYRKLFSTLNKSLAKTNTKKKNVYLLPI